MSDIKRKRLVREVNFENFLKVVRREGTPAYLPFYEHIASGGFIADRTGTEFDKMRMQDDEFWPTYVDFWLGMGYDCIPMEIGLKCRLQSVGGHGESHESEAFAVIKNRQDFEEFNWPDESDPIDFSHFETVSKLLPDGIKIVGGVCGGPFEWVSKMLGIMGMSYLLVDDPDLVGDMFRKMASLHLSANRQLATMDCIGALRQGDDLGFKTSTFLKPEQLRKHVFPIYRGMAEIAHDAGKPFILHSCGNLADVYDDIIDCGVDAKHSYEDIIMPVEDFKKQYGDRITPLGGLDVDFICRHEGDELRRYAREKIEQCFCDGYWALGTGNSLTNYMPVENFITILEEGMAVAGG